MVKLTQLYSLGSNILKNPVCISHLKGNFVSSLIQKRGYADKDEKPQGPAKEEQVTLKMPGFVHPENMKEEGYFTQKAKKQLEELKKKQEYIPLNNPDRNKP